MGGCCDYLDAVVALEGGEDKDRDRVLNRFGGKDDAQQGPGPQPGQDGVFGQTHCVPQHVLPVGAGLLPEDVEAVHVHVYDEDKDGGGCWIKEVLGRFVDY